jgi:hypothetical protein
MTGFNWEQWVFDFELSAPSFVRLEGGAAQSCEVKHGILRNRAGRSGELVHRRFSSTWSTPKPDGRTA